MEYRVLVADSLKSVEKGLSERLSPQYGFVQSRNTADAIKQMRNYDYHALVTVQRNRFAPIKPLVFLEAMRGIRGNAIFEVSQLVGHFEDFQSYSDFYETHKDVPYISVFQSENPSLFSECEDKKVIPLELVARPNRPIGIEFMDALASHLTSSVEERFGGKSLSIAGER